MIEALVGNAKEWIKIRSIAKGQQKLEVKAIQVFLSQPAKYFSSAADRYISVLWFFPILDPPFWCEK